MNEFHFKLGVGLVFLFGFGVELTLILLNLSRAKKSNISCPPNFLARLGDSPNDVENVILKSQKYTVTRLRFEIFSLIYAWIFTLILLFSGILPWIYQALSATLGNSLHKGVVFLVFIFTAQFIHTFPLNFYSTFKIEAEFGFNTTTLGVYLRDLFKSILMSMVLGLPLLYLMVLAIDFTGSKWWLVLLGLIFLIQIIMLLVYPIFIAPWFNNFKPMEAGTLKDSLVSLSNRLNFSTPNIFVMDGSRRSLHANAYFTGFGRWRRIVLFDTLLNQMEPAELESILAHEIGHSHHKHIFKSFFLQIIFFASILIFASAAIRSSHLFSVFGFRAISLDRELISDKMLGLFLFFSVFSSLGIYFSPLFNFFSRRHEFEADHFALTAMGGPLSMVKALKKLTVKNLSNLNPHPWYQFFHYSHPTTLERILRLESISRKSS